VLKEAILGLIPLELWVVIGRFSQTRAWISNCEMNLRLNSMGMLDFLKLFTILLVLFGGVHYSAEILGYGCKIMPILDIHQ
jgi:hypothetical protein